MFLQSQTSWKKLFLENLKHLKENVPSKKISKKMLLQTSGFNFVNNFFMEILNLKQVFVLETLLHSPNFLIRSIFKKVYLLWLNEARVLDFNTISSLSSLWVTEFFLLPIHISHMHCKPYHYPTWIKIFSSRPKFTKCQWIKSCTILAKELLMVDCQWETLWHFFSLQFGLSAQVKLWKKMFQNELLMIMVNVH